MALEHLDSQNNNKKTSSSEGNYTYQNSVFGDKPWFMVPLFPCLRAMSSNQMQPEQKSKSLGPVLKISRTERVSPAQCVLCLILLVEV